MQVVWVLEDYTDQACIKVVSWEFSANKIEEKWLKTESHSLWFEPGNYWSWFYRGEYTIDTHIMFTSLGKTKSGNKIIH